jgi:cytidine deaminase
MMTERTDQLPEMDDPAQQTNPVVNQETMAYRLAVERRLTTIETGQVFMSQSLMEIKTIVIDTKTFITSPQRIADCAICKEKIHELEGWRSQHEHWMEERQKDKRKVNLTLLLIPVPLLIEAIRVVAAHVSRGP